MISSKADALWQPFPVCADARLRHWLLDRGSLTRRIQLRCDRFHVELLSQRAAAVDRDECAVIGVRPGMRCVVREVSLNCGQRPVVFAHSVVEPRALRGPWRMLVTLGARPLGAALFANPRVKRYPLRFRQLSRQHELFHRACTLLERPPSCLWARRSLFVLRGSRLLVTEVFLPAILALAP
jgi:chorismate--pyruvate lyase